ncbi:LysR family transcriptional regulator [Permianibacter sp. IMCC34836]|nr:LysR family transcriptional regulator [Permianibacter fluminis]
MDERLKGIASFVQAVEAGSFAVAAERLHQTRSAVGKSIARLELRLGVRLFHRTTRSQSLTESGQLFYERCKRLLAELEAAEAELDAGGREPMGRLRITAPTLLGRLCVAPILSQLVQRYPQLELEMAFTDRVIDLLEEGFDLAVRIGDLPDSASLAARPLGTQQLALYAAPHYLHAHGEPNTADEFAGHSAIAYAGVGPETPWQIRDAGGHIQELKVKRRLRFNDVQAMADAAMAGAGITRLPHWLATTHVQRGELKRLAIADVGSTKMAIHALWPQQRHLPAKMRVAIDALVAEMPARLTATLPLPA